jgi:formylglycine-generating enzyme required for sulfatase activity
METPAPVCSRESGNSEQGLCDLAGNVWEWVQDDFTASYQGAPTDESARQDAGGARKVCRGGSWRAGPAEARATNRFSDIPNALGDHRGFRLAR